MQNTSIRPASVIPQQQQKKQQPGQWQMLVNSLLRPPRMRYSECQLGYKNFTINKQQFTRNDVTVTHNSKKIQLSIFNPIFKNNCLILYLHGNSSSKLQSKLLLPYLPERYSLACFDFIGCGNNNQRDVITLGHDQSKQVQSVVQNLRDMGYLVYLWGRSMGAASAILCGKCPVIVADSPFRSMKKLCKELSTSKINPLPKMLVNCLFPCVFWKLRSDIKNQGKYDIDELDIQKAIQNLDTNTTLIFITGNEDDLVHHSNSEKLFSLFKGSNKYLEIVPGNHNSKRPDQIVRKIMGIIEKNRDSTSNTQETVMDHITRDQIQLKIKEEL